MGDCSSWNRVTVEKRAEISITEKKSVFIGVCAPLGLEDPAAEAADLVAHLREEHPGARHVVYAYSAVKPTASSGLSDDGEPKGTGGMPVFGVLRNNGVDQAVIAVVRYFGGILLGAAGLRRAYSAAAAAALEAAGPVDCLRLPCYSLDLPYALADKFMAEAAKIPGVVSEKPEYGAKVSCVFAVPDEEKENFFRVAAALFKGDANICEAGYKEVFLKRR